MKTTDNMRQIKFRGQRIDNGEWVYGDLMYHRQFEEENPYIKTSRRFKIEWIQVRPDTIGQFTGMKINGVDLYEGDPVKFKTCIEQKESDGVIRYDDFDCGFFIENNDQSYPHVKLWLANNIELINHKTDEQN